MSSSRKDAVCCSLFCYRSLRCKHNVTLQIKFTDGLQEVEVGSICDYTDRFWWRSAWSWLNTAQLPWTQPWFCDCVLLSRSGAQTLRWTSFEVVKSVTSSSGWAWGESLGKQSTRTSVLFWRISLIGNWNTFMNQQRFFYSETRRETKLSSAAAFTNKMSV